MSMGMRCVAVAAVLYGSTGGCVGPHCPKGYDQIDDTCYRKKDAGAVDAGNEEGGISHGDANEAGDDIMRVTEEDADAGDEGADAARKGADAGHEGEDASVTPLGDAATPCIPSAEVCDGKDNDCDGRIDEETQTWYCDADGDGFAANAAGKIDSCEKPPASASCSGWTTTAPSGVNAQDCDDKTALRFPGAGFGLAAGSNGDLNCDGQTETRLEFVASRTSAPFYSSTSTFNICQVLVDELLGSSDAGKCDCWFSTAIGGGFVGFTNGSPVSDGSGWPPAPWFMQTFPCSERLGDVIFLSHAGMIGTECQEDRPGVVARQLCR
jgi:hypothetical protein